MTRAPRHLLSQFLVRAVAALALLAILAGLPMGLVVQVGWPLPHAIPALGQLTGWLTSPISDTVIIHALAVAVWLLWAGFIPAVATEVWAARRGLPTPATTGTTRNPLRIGAAALVTALALGGLPTAGVAVATTSPTAGDTSARPPVSYSLRLAAQHGPGRHGTATIHVGTRRYTYVVHAGDSLSRIAAIWLGDPNRWPEICRANWHRHWAGVGGTLTDCDLIFPGWDLQLPPDATPPSDARPLTPARATPTPAPSSPASPPPTIGNPASTATAAPMPASPTPLPFATTPGAEPAPDASTSGTSPAPHAQPAAPTSPLGQNPDPPAPGAGQNGPVKHATSGQGTDEHRPAGWGVYVADSYLPWSLAGAVAAAVALVWLQRRRRHTPASTDDDPTDLPAPVLTIHQEVVLYPGLPSHPDLAERAAVVPEMPVLPPGGVGLVGPGASAAARALLVSMLASGGPRDPDRQGAVVVDGTTLTTLIGADAAALGPWPRLHVADDLDHALRLIEARLLQRARILDEHTVTDLDALRDHAPDEQPLPPILLVGETPPPGARMRTQAVLSVGAGLGITAILLGEWPHGATVEVDPDGHTHHPDGHTQAGEGTRAVDDRLAVLDTDTAVAILATLREAHTGRRPAITLPDGPLTAPPAVPPAAAVGHVPLASTGTDEPDPTAVGSTPTGARCVGESAGKARLRVLGCTPLVEDVTAPGNPLRAKAGELAVFLACHRDGAETRTLRDHLEPGVRIRSADIRVHTNVSNLRHVLGRAAGPRKPGYVTQTGGRYRLDPAGVDVDLWAFRDLLTQARTADAPEDRCPLLQQACDLYAGPLAAGGAYPWVEAHREKVRQEATDAHLMLAGDLLEAGDPQAAADVLDKAIGFDPYNEAVYQAAIRARHALGDRDGIRALLHTLDVALADLDTEPEEGTRELADRLARTIPTPRPNRARRDDGNATSEPLLVLAWLCILAGVTFAAIASAVSHRAAALGSGWQPPSTLAWVLAGAAAGLALCCIILVAISVPHWLKAYRERRWRRSHRSYIDSLRALGVPDSDCHWLHTAAVTTQELAPWTGYGITTAQGWQLVTDAGLSLAQARQWAQAGLDARFAATAISIGATLDQVADLVTDYRHGTGGTAGLNDAWCDLADPCHGAGILPPRNARDLRLGHLLALAADQRDQIRTGRHHTTLGPAQRHALREAFPDKVKANRRPPCRVRR